MDLDELNALSLVGAQAVDTIGRAFRAQIAFKRSGKCALKFQRRLPR
jgi:hypothetical protein